MKGKTQRCTPRRRGSPKAPTEPPVPMWQTCSLCRDIPDRCRAFSKGGDKTEDTIPPAVEKMAVVGAPFYNQETSHSNWCLLRCPECGTYYDWDFEYEYLVNGSEDDINVTRLNPEEGERKAKMVADAVAASEAEFAAESPRHLEALLKAVEPEQVRKAASWLFNGPGGRKQPDAAAAGSPGCMATAGEPGRRCQYAAPHPVRSRVAEP